MRQVDLQDGHRRAPNRGESFEARAVPLEMLWPLIAARVEQADDPSGQRITPGDVRAFVVIAGKAGERQVPRDGQATVFARQDVVNLKGKFVSFLRRPAVLADAPGAPPDQAFEAQVHGRVRLVVRPGLSA